MYEIGDELLVTRSHKKGTRLQKGDTVILVDDTNDRHKWTDCVVKPKEAKNKNAFKGNPSLMRDRGSKDPLWNYCFKWLEEKPVSKDEHVQSLKEKYGV